MGKLIKELNDNGVKINITAVYSSKQVEKNFKKINKKTKVIISILLEEQVMLAKIQFQNLKKPFYCKNIKM